MFRREFLAGGLAFALVGCSAKESTPVYPDPKTWKEYRVPFENETVVRLSNVDKGAIPDIGLKDLYIVPSARIPIVAVFLEWNVGFRQLINEGRKTVGFQPVGNNFTPDIDKTESLSKNLITSPEVFKFEKDSTDQVLVLRRYLGVPSSENPGRRIVLPRPIDSRVYTIVFREGLVEHNGQKSPQSFLSVKLSFDRI